MERFLVVAVFLFSSAANAADLDWKWTKTDTAVQAATIAIMVVDWGQTFDVSASKATHYYTTPNGVVINGGSGYAHEELNPLLGEHPSRGKINTYFVGVIVGHTAIARLLPKPYRRIWQCLWIAGETAVVAHNISAGVKIDF